MCFIYCMWIFVLLYSEQGLGEEVEEEEAAEEEEEVVSDKVFLNSVLLRVKQDSCFAEC